VDHVQILEEVAERTGLPLELVEAHARECCALLSFNETAWRVATERRLPQALVTVNTDLFADLVVPVHRLSEVFDVIVMSWSERTVDKAALCEIALSRLSFHGERSHALLIDNRLDNVEGWRRAGGAGYWFTSDEQFKTDLAQLLPPVPG
jgi:hypothetical protein